MVAPIPHQRSDRDVHGEPPFALLHGRHGGLPLLHGRHRGLPLLHGRHKGLPLPFAIRHSLPFFQSPVANHQSLSFSPFAIRRRSRHSLIANRQSLPFSVVANSLMADTVVCPYYSLFATRCRSSSRQSLIASRCRPRQSLIASRCYHPCDFFSPFRIQLMQQPTGVTSELQ